MLVWRIKGNLICKLRHHLVRSRTGKVNRSKKHRFTSARERLDPFQAPHWSFHSGFTQDKDGPIENRDLSQCNKNESSLLVVAPVASAVLHCYGVWFDECARSRRLMRRPCAKWYDMHKWGWWQWVRPSNERPKCDANSPLWRLSLLSHNRCQVWSYRSRHQGDLVPLKKLHFWRHVLHWRKLHRNERWERHFLLWHDVSTICWQCKSFRGEVGIDLVPATAALNKLTSC